MGFVTYIRFKGEFEYNGLYNLMSGFFFSRDYDFYETRYKDKGNEFEVKWLAEREYDEYNLVYFKVEFHAWDVQKIQVVRHGKPVTLIKTRIQITLDSGHKQDYSPVKVFNEKDKFDGFLKKIHKKVTERERDEYWDVLTLSMQHDLMQEIKSYLGMQDSA